MDIRVAAYSPVTATTATRGTSQLASPFVQTATQSSPVVQSAPVAAAAQNQRIAANPNDGYTDSVRGSLINILA